MAGRTETSKKKGKRSRRSEPPAHTDARLETDERVEEGLDASFSSPIVSPETLDSHNNEEPRPIKKKRGKTVLRGLGMDRHEPKEVAFNERGQPIGDTSVTLSSFIGALVRASVPLYEESWRKVSKQHKDNLWTIVLQRYKLEEIHKKDILRKMGNVLREHRSRTATSVRKACVLEEEQKRIELAKLKPTNLTDQEWKDYMIKACSVKARAKSNFMKEIRQNYTQVHTMSRMGYARLEEKLKKEDPTREMDRVLLWTEGHLNKDRKPANAAVETSIRKIQAYNESRSGTQISSLKDDALTKVLGEDKPGRLTGLGFGVTDTKLIAQAHSAKEVYTLKEKVNRLEAKLEKLIEERERRGESEREGVPQVATPESNRSSNNFISNTQEPTIGQKCKLMSWYNRGEIVAEGTIASTDPSALVHGIPLGLDAWKVWVDFEVIPGARVWRTTPDITLISNAIGSTIAWNKEFISLDFP